MKKNYRVEEKGIKTFVTHYIIKNMSNYNIQYISVLHLNYKVLLISESIQIIMRNTSGNTSVYSSLCL